MRRPPLRTLTVTVALAPALVVLPTVSRPAPAPAPVPPSVRTLVLSGLDAGALRAARTLPSLAAPATFADALAAATTRPAVLTPPLTPTATGTPRYDLVAVSWERPEPGTRTQVRVREGGVWTGWEDLATDDDGPEPGPGPRLGRGRHRPAAHRRRGRRAGAGRPATGRAPGGLRSTWWTVAASADDAPVPRPPPGRPSPPPPGPGITRRAVGRRRAPGERDARDQPRSCAR